MSEATQKEQTLPKPIDDVNAIVAGLLRDLAFAQSNQQKMFGYKRAAASVFSITAPIFKCIRNGATAMPDCPSWLRRVVHAVTVARL